jgi:hypothetical protein
LESRFGSSVRFGAYDGNPKNNDGLGEYSDGGGNPFVLIRNRQAPVKSTPSTKVNKSYVKEDVNNDGSSIQLTSGKTLSDFVTTCKKVMFQAGKKEEQPMFSPDGSTSFVPPPLSGDQIVINSDRLIFSAKAGEMYHFSKKRLGMVTDGEFTVDADDQIVVTTNTGLAINAPVIFLGAYGDTDEPVLLGRTTTFWMYQLCNTMINQLDLMIDQCTKWFPLHTHLPDSHGDSEQPPMPPYVTSMVAYVAQLEGMKSEIESLRDSLPDLMSNRVFTVGGGGSPGYDGGSI